MAEPSIPKHGVVHRITANLEGESDTEDAPTTPGIRKIHWVAPASMVCFLIAGVLLAVGHHLFYQSLNQKPVYTAPRLSVLGKKLSSQQVNTSLGTLFAFLVRSFLSASIAVAFTQIFWNILSGSGVLAPRDRSLRLDTIDAAFSSLSSIGSLFHRQLWLRSPVLLVIALVAWLMAVPAVITPGTISVQISELQSTTPQRAPYANFSSLAYLGGMFMDPDETLDQLPTLFYYNGPSQALNKIAYAVVAGQGVILPILPPATNSSWTSTFRGPSIKCETIDSATQVQIEQNIADYLAESENCENPYLYNAWYGDFPFVGTSSSLAPTPASLVNSEGAVNATSWGGNKNLTIRLAITPAMWKMDADPLNPFPTACDTSQSGAGDKTTSAPLGSLGANSTMLECQLFNSTYQVSFNYTNGLQNIAFEPPDPSLDSIITSVGQVQGPNWAHWADSGESTPLSPCLARGASDGVSITNLPPCVNLDYALLQTLAYQAVMDAFNNMLRGSVAVIGRSSFSANSRILDTVLVDTAELLFLADQVTQETNQTRTTVPDLQYVMGLVYGQNSSGIPRNATTAPASLSDALEELFRNYTVSLLSSAELAPQIPDSDYTLTPVTITTYHAIYVYAAARLWITYGVAILITSLIVLAGFWSLWANGRSYSSTFSTVLRVASRAELSAELTPRDAGGHDPLPRHLAKAFVTFAADGRGKEGDREGQAGKKDGSSGWRHRGYAYDLVEGREGEE